MFDLLVSQWYKGIIKSSYFFFLLVLQYQNDLILLIQLTNIQIFLQLACSIHFLNKTAPLWAQFLSTSIPILPHQTGPNEDSQFSYLTSTGSEKEKFNQALKSISSLTFMCLRITRMRIWKCRFQPLNLGSLVLKTRGRTQVSAFSQASSVRSDREVCWS